MKVNQIKAGAILSYINLAIGSIIPMIYTPIMLRILGQAEYGLYSLSHSITGYLSLLSLGFGSTILRYICKYKAENKKEELRKTFGLFIVIYSILAALVIVGGIVLYFCTDTFFSQGLTDYEISRLKILILIMTVNTAITFPTSVFSSIIISYEKFIFRRIVDIFSTILVPVFNLILLFIGCGSIGMAMSALTMHAITLPIYIYYCTNKLKIKPLFKKAQKGFIKEIMGFSAFVFLGSVVDMLFWATDKVILGALAGSVAVAIYNVGATFNNMVGQFSQAISVVITPKVNSMVTLEGNNKHVLTDIFIRAGRIQYLILALIVSGFIAFGQPFITLWAGAEYAEAYYIALLTMIPLVIPYIQNTGLSIIVAQNKHQFRAIVYLIIAIINAISTYLAVPYFGGIGAALCSCISYLIGQGLIMNIYYYKVTGLDITEFWKNIVRMSFVPVVLCIITMVLANYIDFYYVPVFVVGIIVYTILYVLFSWIVSMNDYEKNFIRVPLRKILHKNK